MMSFIKGAILKRKITLFILMIAIGFGIYNYIISPRQETPEIVAPVALVSVVYPGASPEDIEGLVTSKIEDEVSELEGYDYSYSYSRNSIGVIIVRLVYDTDIEGAWDDLRQRMIDLQSELPSECETISVNTDLTDTAGMLIAMSSDTYSYDQLESYANRFRKALGRIDGVARMDVVGKQEKELVVEVDYEKLNAYQLSYNDFVNLIKSQNIEIPSGTVGHGKDKINVKVSGLFESIEDVENIVIAVSEENGSIARLKDVATVELKLKDSNYKIIHDNNQAILLSVYFQNNKNVVAIGKEVDTTIEALQKTLPDDIVFTTILDQPKTVDASVRNFALNLLQGVVFVIIVVFIGMGLRNAVIVSTAIPSSILITFALMKVAGIKIHQISIAALIVALGMLVDNAIVVSDAIQVRLDNDEDSLSACLNGVKEVAIPVLTSTLTTVAAFLPLLLLNSIAGEYISSLPLIVMISLAVSYLIAILITPTMAYIFFKKRDDKNKVGFFKKMFDTFLQVGFKLKWLIVLMMIGIFCITIYLGFDLGLQFFPFADTDMLYIEIKSEQPSNFSATEDLVDKVVGVINKEEVVNNYTVAIGDGLPKFYQTMPVPTPSKDYAQMMVIVDLNQFGREGQYENMTQYIDHLQVEMDKHVYGGSVTVKQLEQGEPIGAPVVVRISGDNLDAQGKFASQVVEILKEIPGTVNVESDFGEYSYEFFVDVDDYEAGYYGISKYDIQNEVSIALYGRNAGVYNKDAHEYDIRLVSNIKDKDSLDNLGIKSTVAPSKVMLKSIADIRTSSSLPVIKKYDRALTVRVYSNVKYGYSPVEIQSELDKRLEGIVPSGMEKTFDGEKQKIQENFGEVGESAVIALVLVYLILLIQFNSFKQPLVILLTIPLSTFGSIMGLTLSGQSLSFTGILGIVSLLGIVVNNAIVLVDFINTERAEGKSIEVACKDAVNKRFRPIMLSTITTVIGLTPLIYSGSELFVPMAISLMSGLMISTIFTLIVIPVVYSIFMKDYKKTSHALKIHVRR
ncbi:efflux RND transporter permease subunit [Acidaminobacter sp. JC074]|uniref:efflux RND transporter permease subunit n=1 Tax=Acidaminobacter sp. JC074 TaxID=2530199 RepID=UPI001F0F214A|nr:efflux RND transporter permease subunit [Acidaminobacter sp. JC074]MCH4886785.1 efflux RND transporter permease subunit [Acidaminobacter sp. JC074]